MCTADILEMGHAEHILQEVELLQLHNADLTDTVERLVTDKRALEQQCHETELQRAHNVRHWMEEQEELTSKKEAAEVRAQEAQLRSEQWAHQVGTLEAKLQEVQTDLSAVQVAKQLSQEHATQELDAQAHIASALEVQLAGEAEKLVHERQRVTELEVQLEKATEVEIEPCLKSCSHVVLPSEASPSNHRRRWHIESMPK